MAENEERGRGRAVVVVAGAGICLAIALAAWALLSHPTARSTSSTATSVVTEAKADEASDDEASADTETDGRTDSPEATLASLLGEFDSKELEGLEAALQAWKAARGIDATAEVEVVGSPTRTELGRSAILRIPSTDVYLTAQLSESGSWSITRLVEKLPGINDEAAGGGLADDGGTFDSGDAFEGVALVSQREALARYIPTSCADSLADDMEAAGIRSAGAWVDVTSVDRSADVTSFKVFVPIYINGGEDSEIWQATWSAGTGTTFERLG